MSNGFVAESADSPFGLLNILSLLTSAAIIYIAWQAWSARPRLTDVREQPVTEIPGDLHPAYAGLIASGRVRDVQIEATVLELIRRGTISLEPDADDRTKVQLRIADTDQVQIPLEQELIRLLQSRAREGVVGYRTLNRSRNNWGSLRRQLRQDGIEMGWLNPSSSQTRLAFIVPGLVGIALAIVLMIVAFTAETGWPVLGAIITGLTGSVALSIGNIIPETTREGEEAAIPWRGLRTGLARARDERPDSIDLDRAFPYIVAMGMAAQYDRHLRRASQSGYIPAWIGRRSRVQEWPEGWHTYWIALHTALAPTDPANTTAPTGSAWRRSITGGRF
ncbi:MAG: hypothetical protein WD401_05380 [Thermomicrobiaceae bacterium]